MQRQEKGQGDAADKAGAAAAATIRVKVLFHGGLDLVFKGAHQLDVDLPAVPPATVLLEASPPTATAGDLIRRLAEAYALPHKRHFFSRDGTVTPGILVLVNEADWELDGGDAATLADGDEVIFVSTLHGG